MEQKTKKELITAIEKRRDDRRREVDALRAKTLTLYDEGGVVLTHGPGGHVLTVNGKEIANGAANNVEAGADWLRIVLDTLEATKPTTPNRGPMPVVYIAHPVSGDIPANLASAKDWAWWAMRQGVSPIASYIPLVEQVIEKVGPEGEAAWREKGLACDFAAILRVDEVWLCGRNVSQGMQREAWHALSNGIPVFCYHQQASKRVTIEAWMFDVFGWVKE